MKMPNNEWQNQETGSGRYGFQLTHENLCLLPIIWEALCNWYSQQWGDSSPLQDEGELCEAAALLTSAEPTQMFKAVVPVGEKPYNAASVEAPYYYERAQQYAEALVQEMLLHFGHLDPPERGTWLEGKYVVKFSEHYTLYFWFVPPTYREAGKNPEGYAYPKYATAAELRIALQMGEYVTCEPSEYNYH